MPEYRTRRATPPRAESHPPLRGRLKRPAGRRRLRLALARPLRGALFRQASLGAADHCQLWVWTLSLRRAPS